MGGIKHGNPEFNGNVAMPMDSARTSDSRKRVVRGPLQLQKAGRTQTLTFPDGKVLGPANDSFGGGYKNGAQRWALLYKYTGLSGSAHRAKTMPAVGRYGWDLKQPFFFTGLTRGFGIFLQRGRRIRMIRSLGKKTVRVKATHKLENSTKRITPPVLESLFIKNAKKFMGK